MELVAFLGKDKETWGQLTGLINNGEWEKIVLIKNKDSGDFPKPENGEIITIDSSKKLVDLRDEISKKIKGKLSGLEVALSIASGSGKEHMALISSLLTFPMGIRMAVFTKKGIEYLD